jgi:hypothetical protein
MRIDLFPKNEEWSTGDEALDLKLNSALKKVFNDLSEESISDFYFSSLEIKTRVQNPFFKMNIALVTKALLYYLDPNQLNDHAFKKLISRYSTKEKIKFDLTKKDILIDGLKMLGRFRLFDQVDFYLEEQGQIDRNPYVPYEIKKAKEVLEVKILFKETRRFLEEEIERGPGENFFTELKGGKKILQIDGLGEIWFHEGLLYALHEQY